MEFKHNWELETEEKLSIIFEGGHKKLHDLIVDTAIENLKNTILDIPVVSIHTKDTDTLYDIIINREDIIETLEQNLISMEKFEDYERCQKIVNALSYLNQK